MSHPVSIFNLFFVNLCPLGTVIVHKKTVISVLLITSFLFNFSLIAHAQGKMILVTTESWSKHITLKGKSDNPVVISPLSRINLSENTKKVVVVPEKLEIKDEIQEFRMFRNRYVIFGIYLSLALYYNWLTRYR